MARVSSVDLITTGNIIMASATPPDRAEKVFIGFTIHRYAIIPITIDGILLRISMHVLKISGTIPFLFSARNIPAIIEIGVAMKKAIPTVMNVPIIALEIPPPSSPTGFGR